MMTSRTLVFAVVALALVSATHGAHAQIDLPMPKPAAAPAQQVARVDSGTMDAVVAVVGNTAILRTDVEERIVAMRAGGAQLPTDSAGQRELLANVLNQLVDEELILQKAKAMKIEIPDNDLTPTVDKQVQSIRSRFTTELEYRTELRKAGFGTPEEYRRFLMDMARRQQMQVKLFEQLREEKKLPTVPATDAEVDSLFNAGKGTLPQLPATVTLRQVVVAPKPSPKADSAAMLKADTIYTEIKKGGDFEQIAKHESMDPGTKELGGDFGWRRRGDFVPEFDAVYFSLLPGQVSLPFKTAFGWHIVRVDRVAPNEVKGRHILIRAKIDSNDIAKARHEADSVAAMWRAGAKFDTLVAHYHDVTEEKAVLTPFPQEKLPVEYQTAIKGHKAGDILAPFSMTDKQRELPKFFVVELLTIEDARDPSAADYRDKIRETLTQEKSIRRYLDQLRKQSYVVVRI